MQYNLFGLFFHTFSGSGNIFLTKKNCNVLSYTFVFTKRKYCCSIWYCTCLRKKLDWQNLVELISSSVNSIYECITWPWCRTAARPVLHTCETKGWPKSSLKQDPIISLLLHVLFDKSSLHYISNCLLQMLHWKTHCSIALVKESRMR